MPELAINYKTNEPLAVDVAGAALCPECKTVMRDPMYGCKFCGWLNPSPLHEHEWQPSAIGENRAVPARTCGCGITEYLTRLKFKMLFGYTFEQVKKANE